MPPEASACHVVTVISIWAGALLLTTLPKGFVLTWQLTEWPHVPRGAGAVSRNRVACGTWLGRNEGHKVLARKRMETNLTMFAETLEQTILAPVSSWTASF